MQDWLQWENAIVIPSLSTRDQCFLLIVVTGILVYKGRAGHRDLDRQEEDFTWLMSSNRPLESQFC